MKQPSALLVANWKMHGTLESVQTLLLTLQATFSSNNMKRCLKNCPQHTTIILPPTIFLHTTATILQEGPIRWGGQTMASATEGAYTGEVSGPMLKEFGCRYVLLGHSERRQYYGETDADIKKKCKLALNLGLTPILCCGETLTQQKQNKTKSVLQKQLSGILSLEKSMLSQMVIAYEPIWAIGTGLNAEPAQIQATLTYIRSLIAETAGPAYAEKIPILYGGSVNAQNSEMLFKLPEINGALVGGASLNPNEFLKICHSFLSV